MHFSWSHWSVCALFCLGLCSEVMAQPAPLPASGSGGSVSAPAPPSDATVDLLFVSELAGKWYPRRCTGETPSPKNTLADIAGMIAAARAQSAASLVVGGGGLLGVGNTTRYLLSTEDGSRQAARLLKKAGIEVLGLGIWELAVPNQKVMTYLAEARKEGLTWVASNLDCAKDKPELCASLQKQFTVTRGGLNIGILSLLPETMEQIAGPENMHGAKISERKALIDAAKAMRSKVDALVVLVDQTPPNLNDVLAMARLLETAGAHADVVMVTELDSAKGGVTTLSLNTGTLVVGTPERGAGITRVSVRRNGPATATRILDRAQPDAALNSELVAIHQDMCQKLGATVASLPGDGMDREGVMDMVLGAMREETHAEIAIFAQENIFDDGLPLKVASDVDVGRALPLADKIVRGSIGGDDLTTLMERVKKKDNPLTLVVSGLEEADKKIKVNGRVPSPENNYTFVTTDNLMTSGLLPEAFSKAKSLPLHLRQLVLKSMQRKQTPQAITAKYRLDNRPLWSFLVDAGFELMSNTISNPFDNANATFVYDRNLLNRVNFVNFKLDGRVRVMMDLPKHSLQLSFRAQFGEFGFGLADPTTGEGTFAFSRSVDLINFDARYAYRAPSLRSPWIPCPFVSVGLETEFAKQDFRNYYHFEPFGLGGAMLFLPKSITIALGVGAIGEVLADPNSANLQEAGLAHSRFLFAAIVDILRQPIIPKLGEALMGEISATYYYTDPGNLNTHELKLSTKLQFTIGYPLFLFAGVDLYVFRDLNNLPGVSLDVLAGLKVSFGKRHQVY